MASVAFIYSAYAIFQADEYHFTVEQALNSKAEKVFVATADLNTWSHWSAAENAQIEYQIDTQTTQPILRWQSTATSISGYRQKVSQNDQKIRFQVVDGSGAEFEETLSVLTEKGQTQVVWDVQGNSDDFVEKLMRPMIVWLLSSQYESYLQQLDQWLQASPAKE